MAGAGLWWQRAVAVLVVCCAQAAHAAALPRLVVVPSQRTQAPDALAAVASGMAAPLSEVVEVVPTSQYTQAAQMARMGPNLASGSAGAVLLGAQVGATHVLYLRVSSEQVTIGKRRKRSRDRLTLAATLVDTSTGATVLSSLYPAGARGLAASDSVARVVADVKTALTQTVVAQAAPLPVAAAAAASKQEVRASAVAQQAQTAQQAPQSAGEGPKAAAPAVVAADAASVDPYAAALRRQVPGPVMGLGLRAQLGLMVFGRQATMAVMGVPRMQYGLSRTGHAPALSQGTLLLEAFPVQLARRKLPRKLYDGIGVHVGGSVGWPKTRINPTQTATSLTSNVRAGLTFRHLFGHSGKSPEAAFRLGYSNYAFAMPTGAAFPGLSYSSVYLGLSADVPLGNPVVAIKAEAALMPALHTGNQAKLLGVHRGGGIGAWVEAGLRISPVRHFDILALFDWQHYGANFVGSTVLPSSAVQYANVTLREVSLGGRLALGTTF